MVYFKAQERSFWKGLLMIILLFTLLAIALTITVAGLLLSLKTSLSDQQEVSYMVRDGGVRRASIDRQRRIKRSVTIAQRRSWGCLLISEYWSSFWLPGRDANPLAGHSAD